MLLSPWTGATLIRVKIQRSVRLVVLLLPGLWPSISLPDRLFLYPSFFSLDGTHTMQQPPSGYCFQDPDPGGNMNPQYPGSKGSSLRFFVGPKVSQAIAGIKKLLSAPVSAEGDFLVSNKVI
jgi:hypothetical protein